MSDELREKLEKELAEVTWRDVRVHVEKDAVILVDPQLNLVDVAVVVAGDDTDQVGAWIEEGRLAKPNKAQLGFLETHLEKPFRLLIARPFLLVQETGDDAVPANEG